MNETQPKAQENLTKQLAICIVKSNPSDEAIAAARLGILDFLASAFAGVTDNGFKKLKGKFSCFSQLQASAIGVTEKIDVLNAALLNGYVGHALDYDDVHGSARGHPSTVVLPAIFAIAEIYECSAKKVLQSYVVGVETMARLGLAIGGWHYDHGFHQTATVGTIGAAAAIAFLLDFSTELVENTISIAATQAFGLRVQFGSEVKPLHAGLAARAGVFAAQIASTGLSGAKECFDGPIGFLSVFGGTSITPRNLVTNWGVEWQIVSPGLYFKPYPCCIATHYAAEAALFLKKNHDIVIEDITEIKVIFPENGDVPLQIRNPSTGLEGRFSVEYVVAVALIDGFLGVNAFMEKPIGNNFTELFHKVKRDYDYAAPRASSDPTTRFSILEIKLKNGLLLSKKIDKLPHSIDLILKFHDATANYPNLSLVPQLVNKMETPEDFLGIIKLFRSLCI